MRFALCLTQEHNLWLVGLAAVICLLGSHITFRLLQRLRHAEEGTRVAWTFMGAVATGATIWCTHFVAMIAYQPGIPVEYEPILTGASLGLAILGSALALWVANHDFRAAGALGGMIFGRRDGHALYRHAGICGTRRDILVRALCCRIDCRRGPIRCPGVPSRSCRGPKRSGLGAGRADGALHHHPQIGRAHV